MENEVTIVAFIKQLRTNETGARLTHVLVVYWCAMSVIIRLLNIDILY